jgi:uncharacterized repeat protein (TIGR02543 family)
MRKAKNWLALVLAMFMLFTSFNYDGLTVYAAEDELTLQDHNEDENTTNETEEVSETEEVVTPADEVAAEETDVQTEETLVEEKTPEEEILNDGVEPFRATFDANGGAFDDGRSTVVITYVGNTPGIPSRTGYIFTGWYLDKECTQSCSDGYGYLITSGADYDQDYRDRYNNKTIYAGWDDNCYTVTFVVGSENGNDPEKDTGYYVKGMGYPETQLKTFTGSYSKSSSISGDFSDISGKLKNTDLHYAFEGWYTDEARTQKYTDSYLNSDITLYAKYKESRYVVNVHASTADDIRVAYTDANVIGETRGGVKNTVAKYPVEIGQSIDISYNFLDALHSTKTKQKIVAYYLDKECTGEAYTESNRYTPTGDVDIWFKWEEDTEGQYITLDPNGGFFVNIGGRAKLDELHLEYINPENSWGDSINYSIFLNDNIALINNDPHRILLGWATTANAKTPKYNANTRLSENKWQFEAPKDDAPSAGDTLYAVWGASSNVVAKFDANGGEIVLSQYDRRTPVVDEVAYIIDEKGTTHSIEITAKRDGYTFNGWFTDKAGTKPLELLGDHLILNNDVNAYAKWIKNYSVTFEVGEGAKKAGSDYALSVTEGATIAAAGLKLPANPTPKNSNEAFMGWCKDAEGTQLVDAEDIRSLKIDKDTTFYAKYATAHTVTFDAGEGSFVGKSGSTYQVKVPDGASIDGRYPTVDIADEHKVFKGWFDASGKEVNVANYVVNGDVTFTAEYTDCYVVTFHSNKSGVKLDGVAEEISVKVPKGESLRYGKTASAKAEVFNAPTVNFATLQNSAQLPITYAYIDYGLKSAIPSPKHTYVCAYALNREGTGDYYFLSNNKHIRRTFAEGEKYYTDIALSNSGFVPTKDTDLYVVWGDKIKITFDTAGKKLNDYYFSTNNSPSAPWNVTISSNATQVYAEVAKGSAYIDFIDDVRQGLVAGENQQGWTVNAIYEDKAYKKVIANQHSFTKDATIYVKWMQTSEADYFSNDRRVTLHAGDNGYFGEVGKTTEGVYWYSSNYPMEWPIPQNLDASLSFNGWYTDAACTKLYNGPSQRLMNGKSAILITSKTPNLYAGYSKAGYVKFDANGGFFDEDINRTKNPSEELKSNSKIKVKELWAGKGVEVSEYSARVRRDGDKVFAGWYLDAACTKKAAITTEEAAKEYFIPSGETTLYAKWIDYTQPTSIKLNSNRAYNIAIGQKLTLKAQIEPQDANIKWYLDECYSSDKNQKNPIRLTTDGVVTGLAAGQATVHAEANGLISDAITIVVANKQVGTSITLDRDKLTLVKDQVVNVNAEITPETAKLTWKTSNTDVAAIEANGTSVAIKGGKNGTATITAAIGTVKKTVTVTVVDPIILSAENLGITALTSMHGELEAILAEEDATVTWTSSDESIATVAADSADSKKAVVTPAATFNTEKTVTITAEATIAGQTYSKDCAVVLYPVPSIAAPYAVDGISLEGETATDVRFGTKVRFVAASHGASIYYTTSDADNAMPADPTALSAKYTDAIELTNAMVNSAAANQIVIKAIAILNDNGVEIKSPVVTFTYQMKDADSDWGDIIQEDRAQWNNKATNVTNTIWLADASVAEVKTYTGKAQTFANLRVYYGKTLLVEKKDYTVKYTNNVNAAESTAVKAPTVTITGKDKYTGSFKKTFTINKYAFDGNDNIIAVANSYNYPSTKSGVKLSGLIVYAVDNTGKNVRTKLAASTYTVTYADEGSDKLTAVPGSKVATITMKGNYEGTLTVPYTVYDATKSISKLANISLKLNNKAATKAAWDAEGVNPDLVVTTKKNEPLTIGEDYKVSVSYNGNGYAPFGEPNVFEKEYVSADDAISLKSVGKYYITISGIGEYTGEVTKTFDVTGKNLTVKDFTVSDTKIATETPYTGEKVYPTFKVFDGKTDITGNTAAYIDGMEVDAVEVGTYTIGIYGKCDAGYNYAPIRKTFKITGEKLAAGRVKPTVSSFVYDGQNITLEDINVVVTNAAKIELAADVDYTAALYDTYKNATNNKALTANVGTKKLVITGIGKYTGTITKDIKVTQADIAKLAEGRTVTATVADAAVLKGGAKPVVTVTDSLISENLVLGKDYKVAYTNNKAIATVDAKKAPTATITFTGNYKGKLTAKFNISAGTISDAKITAVDIAAAKFNPSNLKATLVGTDGVKLAANTDYKLKYYYNAGVAGIEYKRGKQTYTAFGQSVEVQKNDELTAGTEILIVAEGIKNFEGQCQTVARVFAKNHDISKATITIAPQTYTGSQIILTEEDITKHVMNKLNLVYGQDYIIDETSYVKNTAKGNAKVTFKGIGEYAGTKTVEFKIVAKTMN